MNSLPAILRTYCILAIILLAWLGWNTYSSAEALRKEAADQEVEISRLSEEELKASQRYTALEAKQRRERRHYTGEQAVMASSEVMKAKEIYEALNTELKLRQEALVALQATAATRQLRIVPIIAIALLHLFGFFMIRPQRESA